MPWHLAASIARIDPNYPLLLSWLQDGACARPVCPLCSNQPRTRARAVQPGCPNNVAAGAHVSGLRLASLSKVRSVHLKETIPREAPLVFLPEIRLALPEVCVARCRTTSWCFTAAAVTHNIVIYAAASEDVGHCPSCKHAESRPIP